jgi:CheY-like chemotaxis protein
VTNISGLFSSNISRDVLVAENNRVNQKLVANMLKRMGHTSDLAFNGKNAIGMLEENPHLYDVIIMDIQMPVMDGLEAREEYEVWDSCICPF